MCALTLAVALGKKKRCEDLLVPLVVQVLAYLQIQRNNNPTPIKHIQSGACTCRMVYANDAGVIIAPSSIWNSNRQV